MTDSRSAMDKARSIAVTLLAGESNRTPEKIDEIAEQAAMFAGKHDKTADINLEQLKAELRHQFSVSMDAPTILQDVTGHQPWLPTRRAEIKWRFWNRYRDFLELDFGMPPPVVEGLHDLTDRILERLEDPDRAGPWDRRGMVVGSVQSGKTANYVGLINKAVDSGYKIIVVMAGIHSNLRAQTQLRLDEGVLGFDTQKNRRLDKDNRWIGVGNRSVDHLVIHSLTSSAEEGDFNKKVAKNIGVMIGSDPVILVVKKNSHVLKNLLEWILHVSDTEESSDGARVVRKAPLLLIDDEADNASINTKAKPDKKKPGKKTADTVTAINGGIRKLLNAFEKSAYVGYTATPFANIFINPDEESPEHGEDLFPRSFIINVKPPSNYVGPTKVFGLDGDVDAGIPSQNALPITIEVKVDDHDKPNRFPSKHKKDHVPTELPESLIRALRCFVLTCAARRARGQGKKHNSMLVHVTRFVDVQEKVVELLRRELSSMQRRIELGDGTRVPKIRDELQELWAQHFVPISTKIGAEAGAPVDWKHVDKELHAAASKIEVLTINGLAKETLDYATHAAEGRSVIAVGGDKLSRGLTLEGLSISYFLRTSRMYDTLMQMGRWFGYRPGYLDLCRLFTTRQLLGWYRHIALAEVELRREFDYMAAANLTPELYGLRVRTHPQGMIVTALNKMSFGQTRTLSWEGVLVQTTQLPNDVPRISANVAATEKVLVSLGAPSRMNDRGCRIWADVPAETVARYVEALQLPSESTRAGGGQLAAFIRKQLSKPKPELTEWTIVLVSVDSGEKRNLGELEVGLIERQPEAKHGTSYSLKKANILNPPDEATDFEDSKFTQAWATSIAGKKVLEDDGAWLQQQVGNPAREVALALTKRWQEWDTPKVRPPKTGNTERPNGRVLRALRQPKNGLLLIYPLKPLKDSGADLAGPPIIGAALSFPSSGTAQGIEYRVNKVWEAEQKEDAAYEDED